MACNCIYIPSVHIRLSKQNIVDKCEPLGKVSNVIFGTSTLFKSATVYFENRKAHECWNLLDMGMSYHFYVSPNCYWICTQPKKTYNDTTAALQLKLAKQEKRIANMQNDIQFLRDELDMMGRKFTGEYQEVWDEFREVWSKCYYDDGYIGNNLHEFEF